MWKITDNKKGNKKMKSIKEIGRMKGIYSISKHVSKETQIPKFSINLTEVKP